MISYLREKSATLSYFVVLELITQALSLSAGFLLIRLMDKYDYGLLTIATSLQAALIMLIDSGIAVGVMAVGGGIFADRVRYGRLIATAVRLRTVLAAFSIAIIAPVSVWLLLQQTTEIPAVLAITIAILIIGYLQIQQGIHLVTARLAGKANELQILNLTSALARWAGIGLCIFWFELSAQNILGTWVVISAIQNFLTYRIVRSHYSSKEQSDAAYRKSLINAVVKVLPGSLYLMFQSQIAIWVIAIFGRNDAVADFGALGRLAMVFIVASSVMVNIVTPRFSQIDTRILPLRYIQIMVAWLVLCLTIISCAWIFPGPILFILGASYSHLRAELILMLLSSALAVVGGHVWSLNASRGWIPSPWKYIPILLVGQLFFMWVIGVSTVKQLLWVAIGAGVLGLMVHSWVSFINIYSRKKNA